MTILLQPFFHWQRCLWLIKILACVAYWLAASDDRSFAQERTQPSGDAQPASLIVTVTDEEGNLLERSEVSVLQWTGKYEPYSASKVVGKDGQFKISQISTDDMCYLRVVCPGYASSMQSLLSLAPDETREIKFRMSPPVDGWLHIISPNGDPVAGAEISKLRFTDCNKNEVYLTPQTASSLGFEFAPSDARGRLILPPMPRGADGELTVVHADWRASRLEIPTAKPGELAVIKLLPGVRVQVELEKTVDDTLNLNGQMLQINMHADSRSDSEPVNLIHAFPIVNNQVAFTVYPLEYRVLSVSLDSHFAGPSILNYSASPDPSLDLRPSSPKKFRLVVKPKVKLRGKVVTSNGIGVSDVMVVGSFAVDPNASWFTKSEGSNRSQLARQWPSAGTATSDSQGEYEIELARGKAVVEIIKEGYFFEPVALELSVTDDRFSIPDITLFPVPVLRGIVQTSAGIPVPGAYVRMRHTGYGDADPCDESSSNGSFDLKPSRIPYSSDAGLQTKVSVVAIDARSGEGGTTEVNLMDANAVENIRIQLSPRPASWLLNVVKDYWTGDVKIQAERDRMFATKHKEFPAGMKGSLAPAMPEGTWLNTQAKSLNDFRGKFILLDFWFIGCGPCHRDMPTVKMAHRQFSELGFTVVSVHNNGETPDAVQKFATANGMEYPIVVDNSEGSILKQYRALGVSSFPSYILLDSEGRILHNDQTTGGPTLRSYKLERIYEALREHTQINAGK